MKFLQLKAGQRYICGSKTFLEGMPVEVEDKMAKHLLRQRNARNVKYFEELDEEEADALLDALAAGESFEEEDDGEEETPKPRKKKVVARKKKASAKKTAARKVRRRRKPKPVETEDDENSVEV